MKLLHVLIISVVVVFVSCMKEEPAETVWISYGDYYEDDEISAGFVVKLDNGVTVIPSTVNYIDNDIEDSTRVHITYVKKSEDENTIVANKVSVASVLTKEVLELTTENEDSIGNDPVVINDMWFSENHINIIFSYYGYSKIHYINLVTPIDTITGDEEEEERLVLEFRHNANEDPQSYVYNSIVAFNLLNLQEPDMDSLPLTIKFIDYESDTNSVDGTFYFNEDKSGELKGADIDFSLRGNKGLIN